MNAEPLLGVAIVGAIAAFLLATGLPSLRRWYRIRSREPVSIREAITRDGPVEIEGQARPLESAVESPLLGRDCVAYEYEIEERRSSGHRSGSNWRTIEDGEDRVPFLIEDDTGTAYVDPDGASLSLESERTRSTDAEGNPVPDDGSWTVGLSINLPGLGRIGVGNRRYTERRLDVGDSGYVHGRAERPSPGVDADVALVDGEDATFLLSDTSEAATRRRLLLRGGGYAAAGLGAAAVAVWALANAAL